MKLQMLQRHQYTVASATPVTFVEYTAYFNCPACGNENHKTVIKCEVSRDSTREHHRQLNHIGSFLCQHCSISIGLNTEMRENILALCQRN